MPLVGEEAKKAREEAIAKAKEGHIRSEIPITSYDVPTSESKSFQEAQDALRARAQAQAEAAAKEAAANAAKLKEKAKAAAAAAAASGGAAPAPSAVEMGPVGPAAPKP